MNSKKNVEIIFLIDPIPFLCGKLAFINLKTYKNYDI